MTNFSISFQVGCKLSSLNYFNFVWIYLFILKIIYFSYFLSNWLEPKIRKLPNLFQGVKNLWTKIYFICATHRTHGWIQASKDSILKTVLATCPSRKGKGQNIYSKNLIARRWGWILITIIRLFFYNRIVKTNSLVHGKLPPYC